MLAIKRLRKELGLTQKDLASDPEINVTSATISRWENGLLNPSIDKLPILAKKLQCSIDELYRTQATE